MIYNLLAISAATTIGVYYWLDAWIFALPRRYVHKWAEAWKVRAKDRSIAHVIDGGAPGWRFHYANFAAWIARATKCAACTGQWVAFFLVYLDTTSPAPWTRDGLVLALAANFGAYVFRKHGMKK